jgi:hypothetical protein
VSRRKKPISDHSDRVLRSLPLPAQEINPGARGRLLQAGYAEIVDMPSPYKKHRGALIPFYAVSEKGRRYMKDGI